MRTLALAALTMVTVTGASAADAQRIGGHPGAQYPMPGYPGGGMQGGGMPGRPIANPPIVLPPPPVIGGPTSPVHGYPGQSYPGQSYPRQPASGPYRSGGGARWGGNVGGRWSGGNSAPGGWNAYRRPSRGYTLPGYWFSSNFYIGDYAGYGLSAPPQGYRWQRYYDDAVLIDGRGRVQDYVGGLNWDAGGYGGAGGYASSDYGYAQGGAGGAGGGYVQQQDGPQYQYQGQYEPQYQAQYQSLPPVSQNGAVTTYSTSSGYGAQGGYTAGGYYYPGATTTVVTIQGAPSVTTTTTEYIEETTRTRSYVAPRRVYRPKVHYRPVRRSCGCQRKIVRRAPAEEVIQGS